MPPSLHKIGHRIAKAPKIGSRVAQRSLKIGKRVAGGGGSSRKQKKTIAALGYTRPGLASSSYGASPLVKRALSQLGALPLDANAFGTLRDDIARARAQKARLEEQHDKEQAKRKRRYEAVQEERRLER